METPGILFGIYDHFKGGVYLLDGISYNVDSDKLSVEYVSAFNATKRFNRLAEKWAEIVCWPDGHYRSRYVYRGQDLDTPPPPFKVNQ